LVASNEEDIFVTDTSLVVSNWQMNCQFSLKKFTD